MCYNVRFVKYFRDFDVLNSYALKIDNSYVLGGVFLLDVWNHLYQACRCNIDQDYALNQKGYIRLYILGYPRLNYITRSRTRSEQPSDLVTSPRNGVMTHPRKIVRSIQGQAVVTRASRDVSPLILVLVGNGTQQSASFTVTKCISTRCLTCLKFIVNNTFISNVIKKKVYYY